MKFGLSDSTILKIQQVFEKYPQIDKVMVYGSRAKGTFRPGSDIDLTLFGKELDQRQCSEIAEELDELLLPYTIDLSVFDQLKHPDLKEHIERVGKIFYQRIQ
ncbi:MAG: nucleotidyltransferase domain-containing protein [Deltaproteobacteria bacterium]|nr:MAG: nucleotidyltransferase domain-containing protein [Deltaproteobacteria bacterium]